jgi:hypothetical protein
MRYTDHVTGKMKMDTREKLFDHKRRIEVIQDRIKYPSFVLAMLSFQTLIQNVSFIAGLSTADVT